MAKPLRKKPEPVIILPPTVDAWVAGDQEEATNEPPSESIVAPVPAAVEALHRCTFPVPECLYRRVKVYSATTGRPMNVCFAEALSEWIDARPLP